MIKIFIFTITFLFIFSLSPAQEIKVNMQVPSEVQAGTEFKVEISFEKGNLESFSRFNQELPYGLTATRVNTANADFSFEDQRIRFLWLRLPVQDTFTVSYNIRVDERIHGTFSLSGEFSYIEEEERKSFNVYAGHEINIIPKQGIPASQLVHIDDFEDFHFAHADEVKSGELAVIRKTPYNSGPREITVELLVRKNDLNKFAKIEEFVPEGFRAVAGETKDAIFTFNQGMVKYLWMSMPPEPEFIISYKLIPDQDKSINNLSLSGTFSYISDNQSKSIAIVEKGFDATDPVYTVINAKDKEPVKLQANEKKKEKVVVEEKTPVGAISKRGKKLQTQNPSYLLMEEKGLYYRIQLAAGRSVIDIDSYFGDLDVTDNVSVEVDNGWKKYTIGSFHTYSEASDRLTKIRNTTKVKDAFIVSYNNGKRIDLEEALKMTD
jgi:hypothetical protein